MQHDTVDCGTTRLGPANRSGRQETTLKERLMLMNEDSNIHAPPSDWKDGAQWELLAFMLQSQPVHCTGCGAIERHSEVYRVFGLKTQNTVRRYAPVTHVPKGSPVIINSLPDREIPICGHCVIERKGEETFAIRSEAQWQAALLASQRAREAKRDEPKPQRTAPVRVDLRNAL